MRAIRDVSHVVKRQGRAIRTSAWVEEGCACDGIMVDPDGDIFTCGCKKLKIGNVHTGYNEAGERHRSYRDEDGRWEDIYRDECLFTSKTNKAKYRDYVKWLKGEIE